jgi:hypothetical protein
MKITIFKQVFGGAGATKPVLSLFCLFKDVLNDICRLKMTHL